MRVDDEISLRRLVPADVELLSSWLSQDELGYEQGESTDLDSVWSRYFTGRPSKAQWVIQLDQRDVGYVEWFEAFAPFWRRLHGYSSSERLWTFNIFIGDLMHQNRGICRRTIRAVAQYLLTELATVVLVDIAASNDRAARCYQRAGFIEVRRFDGEEGLSALLECRK